MENRDLKDWFFDVRKSLTENTNCLIRIEERLSHFIERVNEAETSLEGIKEHVQSVKTVSRIFTICMGSATAFAALWKLLR